ncbi:MAG: response regulator transcription factor [Anaerolineae bacterium]|nr:response regulator transcription factor [Anaerolineae bacterium]
MNSLGILLVDDHEIVRMGLRMVLEQIPDVQIVAEAGSADEAVRLCSLHQPGLVIMDIRMPPGSSGIDACRTIVQRWPHINVIMLTSYANDELIAESIKAGAVGYVLKQAGTDELVRALDAVRSGAALLDPEVTRRVLAMMRHQGDNRPDPFKDLTDREMDVLRLLAEGKSNAEIADALVLSDKTIRNHISSILDKLHVTNRVEAATYAIKHDILSTRPKRA